ncbi:MAG: response regulator [Saprospiraceae bacterium]|nr:response regulator [Saprospiraceae bacterium]
MKTYAIIHLSFLDTPSVQKLSSRRYCRLGIRFFICLLLLNRHTIQAQFIHDIDSLQRRLSVVVSDTSRALIFNQLSSTYWEYKPDSALFFANAALNLSRKSNFPAGEAHALDLLGLINQTRGDAPKALELYLKGLKVAEKNKLGAMKAMIAYDMGETYMYVNDFPKSVTYISQAIRAFDSLHNMFMLPIAETTLGKTYLKMNQLDSALKYAQLAYQHTQPAAGEQPTVLTNLADVWMAKGRTDLALSYYQQSLDFSRKEKRTAYNAITYCGIAKLYQQINKPDSSIYFAEKALEEAQKETLYPQMIDASKLLVTLYKTKNASRALQFMVIATSAQDSLDALSKWNALERVSNFDAREREYEIQWATTALRNQTKLYFLIAGLVVFLLIAVILYRNNQQKQEANASLAAQKQTIEQQAAELRQLDAAKTRFFANVSHELRTPLTLILAPLSTTLKSNTLDNKSFTLVSLAKQHAQEMLGLVNEILDLTKLESGKMAVHEEATDVYNLMRRLVATFESYAAQRHIKLVFDFDPDVPRGLMLDKPKVGRIFNNLLSNAFKFTPKGGTISIRISHTPAYWQIIVADTGVGIHPDDLPHVFNRFYQTNQKSPPMGGTGIGLSLANELTQVMGGKLTAESTLGKGAKFILTLPKREVLGLSEEKTIEMDEEPQALSINTALSPPSVFMPSDGQKPEKPTVLVVEDNPSLRQYLNVILSDSYHVLTAENGQACLDILENTSSRGDSYGAVSLIISDVMMPVMDGFQLIERLKADEKHTSLPVIMLTARAEMQDRLKALRIGVDDYLTKPFEEEELFARIRNLLTNHKQRQMARQEIEVVANLGVAPSHTDTTEQIPPLSINDQNWLADLEKLVQKHLGNTNLVAEDLAEDLFISRAQFFRRLRLLTGLTPKQYVQEIRFNHARQLLEQHTVSTVKAAAFAIGFQKVQYFSEQFKERFGKSPSDYLT